MKSLPRIVKGPEKERDIKPFDFFAGFKISDQEQTEETDDETLQDEDASEKEQEELAKKVENEILMKARQKADQIISDAREQAAYLREQAYNEGKEAGQQDGFQAAHEEQRELLDEELANLRRYITDIVNDVSHEKDKILEQYIDDLKRISLAVAEKIIQTSLQSSSDIIKRMILSATDKIRKKQWAKIYVTKCDTGISMEVDTEFLEALSALSDNIKLITMDNGEDGTCIIELPDEIIDASVSTQLENIKDILNNVRV